MRSILYKNLSSYIILIADSIILIAGIGISVIQVIGPFLHESTNVKQHDQARPVNNISKYVLDHLYRLIANHLQFR
jgi:hypothetical protein